MANKIKVNKMIIILVIVLVVILNLILLGKVFIQRNKQDGPDMEYQPDIVSLTYYKGGDEYGRSKTIVLKDFVVDYKIDGGTIDESSQKSHDFYIDDYNELDDIINEYSVKEWTNLEKSGLVILDGFTTSMSIEFKDGTVVEVGDDYIMPENGWLVVNKIVEVFEARINN